MTGVVGPGLWPGEDILPAQLEIFEDLTTAPTGIAPYPFLAELPVRGAGATRLGRSLAALDQMPVELGPHGWKLSDRPGMDLDRSQRLLNLDIEAVAIAGAGYSGPLVVDLVGPWTMSAQLYLARGDRALTDLGAVSELGLSLAQGITQLVEKLRSQLLGAELTFRLDEHLLGQIAAGVLPTFSGYSRIPAVAGPVLVQYLTPVLDAVRGSGAKSVVSIGDAWVGIAPAVHANADVIMMDFGGQSSWNERGWELIAKAVEKGHGFWMGLPAPEVSQCAGPNIKSLADTLLVPWQRIGLEPARLEHVAISQSARAAQELYRKGSMASRGALATLKLAAEIIAERAAQ